MYKSHYKRQMSLLNIPNPHGFATSNNGTHCLVLVMFGCLIAPPLPPSGSATLYRKPSGQAKRPSGKRHF